MAEAIIVMTILGIIATIMITNLKIAEYRDKGLQIQAKKVLEQLDQATQHILINDSFDGKMSQLYDKNKNLFSFKDDCAKGVELYKKYLTTKRMPDFTPRYIAASHANYYIDDAYSRYHEYFFLKDGAFVGFLCATNEVGQGLSTWYPFDNSSEMGTYAGTYVLITKYVLQARLIIDVNGVEEPNIMGKDVFKLPLGDIGILYDPE